MFEAQSSADIQGGCVVSIPNFVRLEITRNRRLRYRWSDTMIYNG
ncbi:MAG: hypothetical protein H6Q14_1053 [Bacteroidetes bacterium]|jgi:hypothetical protein|nr:hypothetical protein [Bacteroidota bacterium]